MKKLFLISLIIVQSCIAFAQNCCVNDSIVREIQSHITVPPESKDNLHNQASTSYDGVNEPVFTSVDLQPYYLHGGEDGLLSDLYAAILETAPVIQDCVKGRAAVSFIIAKDGQIEPASIKVIRNWSVPDDYLKAAIEAIKKLGKFEPGKQLGIPKRVTYTILVIYPVPMKYVKTGE